MSHGTYHELSMLNRKLPRSHIMKSKINELNNSFDIRPIGKGVKGFQQSIKTILPIAVASYMKNKLFDIPRVIRVKLSGDGTWVGNKLHLISMTFTTPDLPNARSSEGNIPLALFKDSEKYKFLTNALLDVKRDIDEFKTLEILEARVPIEYYLGGDLRFLNIVYIYFLMPAHQLFLVYGANVEHQRGMIQQGNCQ